MFHRPPRSTGSSEGLAAGGRQELLIVDPRPLWLLRSFARLDPGSAGRSGIEERRDEVREKREEVVETGVKRLGQSDQEETIPWHLLVTPCTSWSRRYETWRAPGISSAADRNHPVLRPQKVYHDPRTLFYARRRLGPPGKTGGQRTGGLAQKERLLKFPS